MSRSGRPARPPGLLPALPLLGSLLGVPVGFLGASPLEAQTVRGTVRAADTGRPLPGAFLTLVDSAGRERRSTLSSEAGAFSLAAPEPGAYAVRVRRIGFRDWSSPPVRLESGDTRSLTLTVPVEPVRLADLEVGVWSGCVTSPGDEERLLRIWREARKALELTDWAEAEGLYLLDLRTYERELSREGEVREERTAAVRGVRPPPFTSLSPEEFHEDGYVRDAVLTRFYHAPDARALLSDSFVRDHCFGLRKRGEGDRGQLGISFEPAAGRDVPEIRGVIWVDRRTAELRSVDYRYANVRLPDGADPGTVGGHIEYRRLAGGPFVVDRWWIRGPRPTRGRRRLEGYWQVGGEVVEVRTRRPEGGP